LPTRTPLPDMLREAQSLRDQGEAARSRERCAEVLQSDPEHLDALNLMAALAADEGDGDAVMRWAERVRMIDPRSAPMHYSLGRLYQANGRLPEAEASYRRVLAADAKHARAHNNLGCVLQMQGRLDQAIESFRRALTLDDSLAQAQQNLAAITRDRGALERAAAGYRREAEANPRDADVCNYLGNVYRELGMHREAIASFDEAIRRKPDHPEAHFSRAQELLLVGELEEGFKEYEWRWQVKGLGTAPRSVPRPQWKGEDLAGGTLLLHAEQGLGDTLQFARYAALAARRCGKLVLECQRALVPLLRAIPGVSVAVAAGDPLPPFDAHLPLMSLPRVFGTTLASIPWSGAYVHADPRRIEAWRSRLARDARLHVGLAWAGRAQYWDDRKRSIALPMLAPLAAVQGAALYSLQFGEGAAQMKDLPSGMRVTDFGDDIREFTEMAALIGALDVVIAVDTAVGHLAGSLGARTWGLHAHAPEWRWLIDRSDSPWYPTMRLYRQQTDGDWAQVIERVASDLEKLGT
jgi:Tfp pilus assembly protein PilF